MRSFEVDAFFFNLFVTDSKYSTFPIVKLVQESNNWISRKNDDKQKSSMFSLNTSSMWFGKDMPNKNTSNKSAFIIYYIQDVSTKNVTHTSIWDVQLSTYLISSLEIFQSKRKNATIQHEQ